MNRGRAAIVIVGSLFVVGLSCNLIVGIDGEDGVECAEAPDCPDLGECTVASCNDGLCQHALAPQRAKCSAGLCDGRASCVECINTEDCIAAFLPAHCSEDGRCVECLEVAHCADPMWPRCYENSCVQCAHSEDCSPLFEPCLEATCAKGVCLAVARPAMDPCPGGECDGDGNCDPKMGP